MHTWWSLHYRMLLWAYHYHPWQVLVRIIRAPHTKPLQLQIYLTRIMWNKMCYSLNLLVKYSFAKDFRDRSCSSTIPNGLFRLRLQILCCDCHRYKVCRQVMYNLGTTFTQFNNKSTIWSIASTLKQPPNPAELFFIFVVFLQVMFPFLSPLTSFCY